MQNFDKKKCFVQVLFPVCAILRGIYLPVFCARDIRHGYPCPFIEKVSRALRKCEFCDWNRAAAPANQAKIGAKD